MVAFGAIQHSIEPRVKKLLVVTADEVRRASLRDLLGGPDLELVDVASGGEALVVIKGQYLDGIVIDLRLSDIPALQLVEEIQKEVGPEAPPTIIYSKRMLAENELKELKRLATASLVKYAQSEDRLLDETALLLHRAEAELSEHQRHILEEVRRANPLSLDGASWWWTTMFVTFSRSAAS